MRTTAETVAANLHEMANSLSQGKDSALSAFVDDLTAAVLFLRSYSKADNVVPLEACEALYTDLIRILGHSTIDTVPMQARNRLHLFRIWYLQNREDNLTAKKLVLRHGPSIIICDEYYPYDNGRIHIQPWASFGHFHAEDMRMEVNKTVFDIDEIVYEGDAWPEDMGSFSVQAVIDYFDKGQIL